MYLYIFKNKTTNKQYIGYTAGDITNYLGSGLYWKNHCNKHGGYNSDNIEKVWYEWFETVEAGLVFLRGFESKNPDYWLTEELCNSVPETLEKSAFKGNMKAIFEKHGNPFTGGEIQRKAHAEGKHDYDKTATGLKSWVNRDRDEASRKMIEGKRRSNAENPEKFLAEQRRKIKLALVARRLTLQKLEYRGEIYYGWAELSRAVSISKQKLQKDPEVIKL